MSLVEGSAESAVRVVIYENLQCGDCLALRHMLDQQILPQFATTVAFEHRDFPLAKHIWSRPASIAARYVEAHYPFLALAFRRFALENIQRVRQSGFETLLREWCGHHDLNAVQVIAALAETQFAVAVEDEYREGVARGVQKTPTIFIGGEILIETFTAGELSGAIERALNLEAAELK